MMSEKVKLYAVAWEQDRPSVVSVEATVEAPGLFGIPQDAPPAFGLLTPMDAVACERQGVAMDPVQAVNAALERAQAAEARMMKFLMHTRRNITELAVLGLSEAGVTL